MTQLTASQLAANDERFPEILENFLMDIKFDITQIDDIVLAIASHEAEQTEATRLEVVATAYRAQLPGIWKQIQAFKNLCQPYKDLLAEVTDNATHAEIELQPQKPAIVDLGGKALVEAMASTDKALDAVKAVATPTKPKEDKAPKPAKVPKAKPTLPLPAIADLAALEAMSRKDLMEATKGVNSNFVTGVRANAASVELKRVLAKHILNTEYIEPAKAPKQAKAPKAGKSKASAAIAPIPEGLTFASVKAMKYRELQALAKSLRENGKFEGNIGGKGATSEALLSGICKGLGFETVHVPAASKKPMLDDNAFVAKYCPNLQAMKQERLAVAA